MTRRRPIPTHRRAFTLTELLVVIAILTLVGTMTVMAFRGIAKDAKLSSGVNDVMGVLDQARGLAMKNNNYVMVVFRSVVDDDNNQFVEIRTAEWTGVSSGPWVIFSSTPAVRPVDQFREIEGVSIRRLPDGIKIACPTYGYGDSNANFNDEEWFTPSNLLNIAEAPGSHIGVLYSPQGTVISRNGQSDSYRHYLDVSRVDEAGYLLQDLPGQAVSGSCITNNVIDNDCLLRIGTAVITAQQFDEDFFQHNDARDEPYIRVAPFLAIYDDEDARERYDTTQWNDFVIRRGDLSEYINMNGQRIHFNRYSGVVTR